MDDKQNTNCRSLAIPIPKNRTASSHSDRLFIVRRLSVFLQCVGTLPHLNFLEICIPVASRWNNLRCYLSEKVLAGLTPRLISEGQDYHYPALTRDHSCSTSSKLRKITALPTNVLLSMPSWAAHNFCKSSSVCSSDKKHPFRAMSLPVYARTLHRKF